MIGKWIKRNLAVIPAILFLVVATTLVGMFNSDAASSETFKGTKGGEWRLAEPITYENLSVFPVLAEQDADTSGFATLDEALASGDAIVTEQGASIRRSRDGSVQPQSSYTGASVNQLVLINRGKRPLLLLAGEVVSGGKQDRIIGKDRIVPIGAAPLPLDVFCVEHGRWTGGSSEFVAAKTMVHPSVREQAAVGQDQGKVWAAVSNGTTNRSAAASSAGVAAGTPPPVVSAESLQTVTVTEAPTQSYRKMYQSSKIGNSVESFAREVERRFKYERKGLKGEHVVGVVIAYGREVAWSDIFASSEMFETYWPKLVRSYVVEALARQGSRKLASLEEAREFLRGASGHIHEETEPGVYRWSEQTEGRIAEIRIEALEPKPLMLHWLTVLRTS
ncbi:MAG: DUF6569 family protein [Candidatus Acidiferrales bacterium]